MKKKLAPALLTVVTAVLWLLLESDGPDALYPDVSNAPQRLQSYLSGGDYWTYDDSGVRSQRLQTAQALQYSGSDIVHLQHIRLDARDDHDRSWTVTAGGGELHTVHNELTLRGGVTVKEQPHNGTLEAEQLVVDMERQRASDDGPVTLRSPSSITTATGVRIDFKAGTATLLNKVKTVYER